MMRFIRQIAALLIVGCAVQAEAEQAPFTIYRNAEGSLTKSSHQAVGEIRSIAGEQGYITLWLTVDYPVNLYLDPLTQGAAIATQNDEIRVAFDAILAPLVASGGVWFPSIGPIYRGPGTLVRATKGAFRTLVRDQRLVQIVAVPDV